MLVHKRDGREEPFDIEKIHDVLFWATDGIKGVTVSDIEIKVGPQFYDGITSAGIHQILVQGAADMITEKTPNYQFVAASLLNYYLRKEVFGVSDNMPTLLDVVTKNTALGIYSDTVISKYSEEEIKKLDSVIKHRRDYEFVYAGLQQLIDKYLLKDRSNGKIYETPQYMYILICMTLMSDVTDSRKRVRLIKELYNDLSTFKISLPTPIMCGCRSPSTQYSSCTLIDVDDNLPSIFNSNTAIGTYTANRAGIGLNCGAIRGLGSKIRSGEVVHTGVVPFLKMFSATTKCCTQNGVRGGGSTTHFPFWHKEIEDILVLKNNRGTEDNRVRRMDYSIQFTRLFYRRVVEDGNITLFSPHEVPDLYGWFGYDNDKFDELYVKYERSRSIYKKQIRARELFNSFCQERIGTGRMYVMNIDHCNTHSSFTDKIKMSNLCQEITLPTTPLKHIDDGDDTNAEIALCVLSAINLGQIKCLDDLEPVCKNIVRLLDSIIDHQQYLVAASAKMKKRRSIGVGVTNLAHYLAKEGVSYESKEALVVVDELMEHVQYYLLSASVGLAKERGACEWFSRTKYASGILPIDTYCREVDSIVSRKLSCDWTGLRKAIKKHGLRNSTVTAIMPCESSALVTNSTNGIEPPRGLLSIKKSKQGLIPQVVPDIHTLRNKYTLAFDMTSNRGYTNIVAVIQKYIDQSISANHYYNFAKYENGNLPMSEIASDILYAYKMGVKTLYYANTEDGKNDSGGDQEACPDGACSI